MRPAVDRYLALRHAAGFDLVNAEYLLRSFARVAAERGETHVRATTAIEWARRGPSVAQRDARLTTICRFARFMRAEDGRHDVPPSNHFGSHKARRVPHIYSRTEITRLIDAARQLDPSGRSHPDTYVTLIALLSATGLRISEALSLQVSDVTPRGLVIRKTKFKKTRLGPMSRWGFACVLHHHATTAIQKCPALSAKRVSPHVLRHTCAMMVLQATQDIRKVSLWLGHSQLATTEVYTRADPSEKLEAIDAIVPPHLRRGSFRPSDKLIALLKAKSATTLMGTRRP